MKTVKNILLFLWQLPQNLLGFIFMLFLHPTTLVDDTGYAKLYKSSKLRGGISLGQFAYVSNVGALNVNTILHEGVGHPKQSRMLGPLYLIVIGIPSLLWAMFGKNGLEYYSFYTEKWADKLAGINRNKY